MEMRPASFARRAPRATRYPDTRRRLTREHGTSELVGS